MPHNIEQQKKSKTMFGILYLIPSPINNNSNINVLPQETLNIILQLDEFIVENVRTARRFIKKAGYNKSINNVIFHQLNKHTQEKDLSFYLDNIKKGKSIGIISESGCPCIADPGSKIVAIAHESGIIVKPLIGPSSILLAIMAAGFNGQNFVFHGYLPIDKKKQQKRLKNIEYTAIRENQTQVFMETPFRNNKLLDNIITSLSPSTNLCIASELTSESEFIKVKSIKEWKKSEVPDLNKKNTVFLIYQ